MAYGWENSTLEQKKAKLSELQAKLAQAKMDSEYRQQRGGLTRAAEAMMPYDPTGAFNLLDKREELDVKRLQAEKQTGLMNVEELRRQLRMNAERAANAANNTVLDEPTRRKYLEEQRIYLDESANDVPSPQNAALKVRDLWAGVKKPGGGGDELTRDGVWAEWGPKLKNLRYRDEADALESEFTNLIAEMGSTDKATLKDQFKVARDSLNNRPGKVDVAAKVDELITGSSTKPIPAAYARYDKSLNAYNAAKASHDSGAIGAALGNYLYSLRPEAVNAGDIDLLEAAVRDSNQQKVKGLLDKFGFGPMMSTDFNAIADKLAASAYKKLADDRAANIKQIKGLLSIYDQAAVERRADMYYKVPVRYTKNKDEAANKPLLGAPTGGKTSGTIGKTTWRVVK